MINIFNQTICDKNCPAWIEKYEICNVQLNYWGRVLPIDSKVQFGMLCKLPNKFKIIIK